MQAETTTAKGSCGVTLWHSLGCGREISNHTIPPGCGYSNTEVSESEAEAIWIAAQENK